MDKIDEERDDNKKRLLLSIFNTNYAPGSLKSPTSTIVTRGLKQSHSEATSPITSFYARSVKTNKYGSTKIVSALVKEEGTSPVITAHFQRDRHVRGLIRNRHSVSRRDSKDSKNGHMSNTNHIRYDPKDDRIGKLKAKFEKR